MHQFRLVHDFGKKYRRHAGHPSTSAQAADAATTKMANAALTGS
jgi:hypothetical protein